MAVARKKKPAGKKTAARKPLAAKKTGSVKTVKKSAGIGISNAIFDMPPLSPPANPPVNLAYIQLLRVSDLSVLPPPSN